MVAPPCQEQPHPFATHDVDEEDWIHVVQGIQTAAATSQLDPAIANSRAMTVGLLGMCTLAESPECGVKLMQECVGMLMSAGVERCPKKKKQSAVLYLVMQWNQVWAWIDSSPEAC